MLIYISEEKTTVCEIKEIVLNEKCEHTERESLYELREYFSANTSESKLSELTIMVQAYNGLNKTKKCVETILKYSSNVDYDLLLVDNGSTDETFEYFKSVDYEKKRIIHINKNIGSTLPWAYINFNMLGRFVCIANNDLVLTKNWISNLMAVIKSDPKIGMVCPMSSNTSNRQCLNGDFKSEEEMQRAAEDFNVSNPQKWEERLRLLTLAPVFRKECLFAMGLPLFDVGFTHNFGDDDVTFRVRRAGYKAVLAGDTWIHHDDVKKGVDYEKYVRINKDLEIGRNNFKEKYYGIDAWNDVNEYISEYLSVLKPSGDQRNERILGINVKCGTPILEIKNSMRRFDVFNSDCYAYTSDSKYYLDLQTVCGANNVMTGNVIDFGRCYTAESFDHIVIGDSINTYENHFEVIKEAYKLLKPNGQLFFSLYNMLNLFTLAGSLGMTYVKNPEHKYVYTAEEFVRILSEKGIHADYITAKRFDASDMPKELVDLASKVVNSLDTGDKKECLFRLLSKCYYFVITKSA